MQFAPLEFRVKSIPNPVAVFAGKSTGSVPRATAAAQQGFLPYYLISTLTLFTQLKDFTVLISDKGLDFEEPSKSSNLTTAQKNLISRLTRGKYLTIKDIKALGPDKKIRDLFPVILKID